VELVLFIISFINSCSSFIEYKLSDLDELGPREGEDISSIDGDGELNDEIFSIDGDGELNDEIFSIDEDGELNEDISSIDGDGFSKESELNIENVELFMLIFFLLREKFPVTVVSHNKSLTSEFFQSVTHILFNFLCDFFQFDFFYKNI